MVCVYAYMYITYVLIDLTCCTCILRKSRYRCSVFFGFFYDWKKISYNRGNNVCIWTSLYYVILVELIEILYRSITIVVLLSFRTFVEQFQDTCHDFRQYLISEFKSYMKNPIKTRIIDKRLEFSPVPRNIVVYNHDHVIQRILR